MKENKAKRTLREVLSAFAQLFGAFIFVSGFLPILNPVKCGIEPGHTMLLMIPAMCLSGAGLLVIFLGRRAQEDLKKDCTHTETTLQKKLKWIIFGIVAVFLLLSTI